MNFREVLLCVGYGLMAVPVAGAMGWWGVMFMGGLGLVFAINRAKAEEASVRKSHSNIQAYLSSRGLK